MANIVVTGGSGFIGTHITKQLIDAGHDVTVVDINIQNWMYQLLPANKLYQVDFLDYNYQGVDVVIHTAASHVVSRSMIDPSDYYSENVSKLQLLLDKLIIEKVPHIIYSGSASVYGGNSTLETDFTTPRSPYARTKAIAEEMIKDYASAYNLAYTILRYFQPVGADPDGKFGYIEKPATHMVPSLCRAIASNQPFTVFGDTYDSLDSDCSAIRDYTHVADVANAHVLALEHIDCASKNETFNVGAGIGYTVYQTIDLAEEQLGMRPEIIISSPRPGDVYKLIASPAKIKHTLGWEPKYTLKDAIQHAYNWELTHGRT